MSHYVQMDFKPYSGCKIQDTSSGRIMAMMKFKLVKGNTADEAYVAENKIVHAGDMNHGTKLIKELVDIWAGKGVRVVASY